MVKLQKSGEQFWITVPQEYVRLKEWKKGQEFAIYFNAEGDLVMKAIKSRQNGSKTQGEAYGNKT